MKRWPLLVALVLLILAEEAGGETATRSGVALKISDAEMCLVPGATVRVINRMGFAIDGVFITADQERIQLRDDNNRVRDIRIHLVHKVETEVWCQGVLPKPPPIHVRPKPQKTPKSETQHATDNNQAQSKQVEPEVAEEQQPRLAIRSPMFRAPGWLQLAREINGLELEFEVGHFKWGYEHPEYDTSIYRLNISASVAGVVELWTSIPWLVSDHAVHHSWPSGGYGSGPLVETPAGREPGSVSIGLQRTFRLADLDGFALSILPVISFNFPTASNQVSGGWDSPASGMLSYSDGARFDFISSPCIYVLSTLSLNLRLDVRYFAAQAGAAVVRNLVGTDCDLDWAYRAGGGIAFQVPLASVRGQVDVLLEYAHTETISGSGWGYSEGGSLTSMLEARLAYLRFGIGVRRAIWDSTGRTAWIGTVVLFRFGVDLEFVRVTKAAD